MFQEDSQIKTLKHVKQNSSSSMVLKGSWSIKIDYYLVFSWNLRRMNLSWTQISTDREQKDETIIDSWASLSSTVSLLKAQTASGYSLILINIKGFDPIVTCRECRREGEEEVGTTHHYPKAWGHTLTNNNWLQEVFKNNCCD